MANFSLFSTTRTSGLPGFRASAAAAAAKTEKWSDHDDCWQCQFIIISALHNGTCCVCCVTPRNYVTCVCCAPCARGACVYVLHGGGMILSGGIRRRATSMVPRSEPLLSHAPEAPCKYAAAACRCAECALKSERAFYAINVTTTRSNDEKSRIRISNFIRNILFLDYCHFSKYPELDARFQISFRFHNTRHCKS